MKREYKRGNLPAGYVRLEYLESTGTQYIDTLYKPNYNTTISIYAAFTEMFNDNQFFNADDGSYCTNAFGVGYTNKERGIIMTFGDTTVNYLPQTTNVPEIGQWLEITAGRDGMTVNDVTYQFRITPSQFSARSNMLLFCYGRNGLPALCGKVKISYFEINEHDAVRCFIPVLRVSDNKPGMYDLRKSICPLTGTPFYVNAGTGEFLYK